MFRRANDNAASGSIHLGRNRERGGGFEFEGLPGHVCVSSLEVDVSTCLT